GGTPAVPAAVPAAVTAAVTAFYGGPGAGGTPAVPASVLAAVPAAVTAAVTAFYGGPGAGGTPAVPASVPAAVLAAVPASVTAFYGGPGGRAGRPRSQLPSQVPSQLSSRLPSQLPSPLSTEGPEGGRDARGPSFRHSCRPCFLRGQRRAGRLGSTLGERLAHAGAVPGVERPGAGEGGLGHQDDGGTELEEAEFLAAGEAARRIIVAGGRGVGAGTGVPERVVGGPDGAHQAGAHHDHRHAAARGFEQGDQALVDGEEPRHRPHGGGVHRPVGAGHVPGLAHHACGGRVDAVVVARREIEGAVEAVGEAHARLGAQELVQSVGAALGLHQRAVGDPAAGAHGSIAGRDEAALRRR